MINLSKSIEKHIRVIRKLLPRDLPVSLLLWRSFKLKLLRLFHCISSPRKISWFRWPRRSVKRKLPRCTKRNKRKNSRKRLQLLKSQRKKEGNHPLPNQKTQRKLKLKCSNEKKC